jgi:hypothetical protein
MNLGVLKNGTQIFPIFMVKDDLKRKLKEGSKYSKSVID